MAFRAFNFNSIPAPKLQRSSFDLSHEFKAGIPMGKLVPFLCMEGLPGDTFKFKVSELTRFMALQSPMMQRVDIKFEFFKVPLRLCYKDFETFITGGESGNETPTVPNTGFSDLNSYSDDFLSTGSLAQYLGLPMPYRLTQDGTWERIPEWHEDFHEYFSLIPFNAYHKIYNEYYRDQNIIDPTPLLDESKSYQYDEPAMDEAVGKGYFDLHNRAWKKDYFTSALNDPQRGQAVAIGLTGSAPVTIPGGEIALKRPNAEYLIPSQDHFLKIGADNVSGEPKSPLTVEGEQSGGLQEMSALSGEINDLRGVADMSNVSAMGIIALRTAFKLQQFLERNNVAGSRYVESILAHFGVKSSDARLQRPELFGHVSFPVTVSPVDGTADTATGVIGEQGGKAKSVGATNYFRTFCEEHCIIMGIMSVMPQAAYCQGMPRMFKRFDKFDYFWSEFQNIGEQAIPNSEVMLNFEKSSENNSDTFGYQSRYSEYKFMPDRICGDLATNLSYWHMARLFSDTPGLNQQFIECNPTDRVFAVKDELSDQKVIADLWITIHALRPMAKYSTPRIS